MGRNRFVQKRDIWIGGSRTSVTLEDSFWDALQELAEQRDVTVRELAEQISCGSWNHGNMSSAIREFVLEQFRQESK